MIRGRVALDADQERLRTFRCPENGTHTVTVQELIAELPVWRAGRSDRQVRLYEEGSSIVAVLAFEAIDPSAPERGMFVPVFAVADGFARQGLGQSILNAFVDYLQTVCPGGLLVFMVDGANTEMCAFCGKHLNVEPRIADHDRDYLEYVVTIPGNAATLPGF